MAPLSQRQQDALKGARITHLTQLLGWGSTERWQKLRSVLEAKEAEALGLVVDLYLHQGIGTIYGNRLAAAGITSLDQLQDRTIDELWHALQTVDSPGRVPTRAQVKVWLRRLPAHSSRL